MQKSLIATYGIIIIIAIYALFSSVFLAQEYNFEYLYIINPLVYIVIGVFLKIAIGKTYNKTKLKKDIQTYSIVATLIYIIVYLVSGLFVTFGKNPYSTDLKGVFINFWILGTVAFFKEYIRYKLINNVYDRNKIKVAIVISIIYIFIDADVYRHFIMSMSALDILKYISQIIMPLIIKNVLYSYIVMNTDIKPVITYELLTKLYMWTSPILPNSPWIMNAIIEIVIPMMMFLFIKYKKSKSVAFKVKEEVDTDPKTFIPFIILIILIILFSIGIFSIRPVAIATGSMEKELFVGDVVLIKKCDVNDIIEGDIIQYSMDKYTVIHRVVQKVQEKGDIYFITKGDNNKQVDRDRVLEDQVIGKVILKIKYIGYPAVWLNLINQDKQNVEVETGN